VQLAFVRRCVVIEVLVPIHLDGERQADPEEGLRRPCVVLPAPVQSP